MLRRQPRPWRRPLAPPTLAALLVSGCAQPEEHELPEVLWQGERIEFRSYAPDDLVCGGTFEHLDRRAAHLADVFGVEPGLIQYTWAPGKTIMNHCPVLATGCSKDRQVFSTRASHEHELVHALRDSAHRGLEEGLAVAFGDDRMLQRIDGADVSRTLFEIDEDHPPASTQYHQLGHFVSFIAAHYGIEALVDLDHASRRSDGFGELEARVLETLGDPLPEVVTEYNVAYPDCEVPEFRYDGLECGSEGVEFPLAPGATTAVSVPVACEDPNTVGSFVGEVFKRVRIDVPERGAYAIEIAVPQGTIQPYWRFGPCGVGCLFEVVEPDSLVQKLPCVDAGAYTLRVGLDASTPGDFEVKLSHLESETCLPGG
ncbi:MAG: hypothetical protein AAF721_23580 [Myxococcota bacterium]